MTPASMGRAHCVVAIIVKNDRVLLAKRSLHRTSYPGVWDIFGGHIEEGELPGEALHRELQEELGITASSPELISTAFDSINPIDYQVFVVSAWQGEPQNLRPDEHSEIRWFEIDALPHFPVPSTRGYLEVLQSVLHHA